MKDLRPDQTKNERLLGIFDIRTKPPEAGSFMPKLEALFRFEVNILRQQSGGLIIVDHTEIRDEWREVTAWGCFPKDTEKYKVT